MSTFPTFYLHFDSESNKTLKVDRDASNDNPFVFVIELEESLAKKLLNGIISENNLLVNHFANPPYVIDRSLFPDTQFYFLYRAESREIVQLVDTLDQVYLKENDLLPVEVEELIAYSILTAETSFSDWVVCFSRTGEASIDFAKQSSSVKASALFTSRTDYLSLVEISLSQPHEALNASTPKISVITFDHRENTVLIESEHHKNPDLFNDFILAITRKNDPSYLIRKLQIKNGEKIKLVFDTLDINDLSFFSSKYHIRQSDVVIKNYGIGSIEIQAKGGSESEAKIKVDVRFSDELEKIAIFLRNKYDRTLVYNVITFSEPGEMLARAKDGVDFNDIEFEVPAIAKHLTKITRV